MKNYLLGIDVGTSACKVALFDLNGRVIAAADESCPVYYPRPGWAEQDPREWWDAIRIALRRVLAESRIDPREIAGIGVDGQSWSAVPVDRNGTVLANTPIWMDTRAAAICAEWREQIGEDRIFRLCGNPLSPSYTTAKIVWLKREHPDLYRKTHRILQSNSYIVYRLTGRMTHDLSQGYGLHCFDMRTGRWDEKMGDAMDIDLGLLPELMPSHSIAGEVTAEASAETGLIAGTPVVAGGLDAACGTLGTGVTEPGETQEQGGQAGGMSICLDTYAADPRLILGRHVVPDRFLLQGGTTGGGGVMRWLEHELGKDLHPGNGSILDLYNREAAAVPAGSDGVVFLPYMAGERSPIWDPAAKGVYYGLDFSKSRGHLIRASMEGVAFSLRHNLETAEQAGAAAGVLRAMGGSANSILWTQIKSDITGKPIDVPASDTATTLGAAILAGVGVGLYRSFRQAAEQTVTIRRHHEPDPGNFTVYDRNYRTYLGLYENLRELMHEKGTIV